MDNKTVREYISYGEEFLKHIKLNHNGVLESAVKELRDQYLKNLKELALSKVDTKYTYDYENYLNMIQDYKYSITVITDDESLIKEIEKYIDSSKFKKYIKSINTDYNLINRIVYYYLHRDNFIIYSKNNDIRRMTKIFNTIFYNQKQLCLFPFDGNNYFEIKNPKVWYTV